MKKVKWITTALIIMFVSIGLYHYCNQTSSINSVKNDIITIERIVENDKLNESDRKYLQQIQDNNWKLISEGKLSGKQELYYVLLEDKIVDDINLYFKSKNSKTKENLISQIKTIKDFYKIK